MSNSLRPHGLYHTRLLSQWNFPGKSTGVGCHFLLQGIFPTQGSNHIAGRCFTVWATREAELNRRGSLMLCVLSHAWLFVTPMDCSPLSTWFSRQEYWSGLPFPSPGDLPYPRIKLRVWLPKSSPVSPALQEDSWPLSHLGSPCFALDLGPNQSTIYAASSELNELGSEPCILFLAADSTKWISK